MRVGDHVTVRGNEESSPGRSTPLSLGWFTILTLCPFRFGRARRLRLRLPRGGLHLLDSSNNLLVFRLESREPGEVGDGSGDIPELLVHETTFTNSGDRVLIYVEGVRKVGNRLTVVSYFR